MPRTSKKNNKVLAATVYLPSRRRKARRKVEDTREFAATDFTRAWRSMRCWAWRKGYDIETEKADAKESYAVALVVGRED